MNLLDFDVKRSKVKVTRRPYMSKNHLFEMHLSDECVLVAAEDRLILSTILQVHENIIGSLQWSISVFIGGYIRCVANKVTTECR